MARKLTLFLIFATVVLAIDQYIKSIFLGGYGFEGECISLVLAYNKGVAFSMFESLGEWLKYIQIILLVGLGVYAVGSKEVNLSQGATLGVVFGAGSSNVLDRFMHGGVVDYVYWHCGFDFAIFNFADVMIDVAIVAIILLIFLQKKEQKSEDNL